MNKYKVLLTEVIAYTVIVEAKDEQEAEDIANQKLDDASLYQDGERVDVNTTVIKL